MGDKPNKKYFQKFPDRLMENLDTMDDQLADLAPILSGLDKKEPYLVPEKYFETAQAKLLVKTGTNRISRPISFGLIMSIAAMILFCCAVTTLVLWPKAMTPDQGMELAELDYLESEVEAIDDALIIDLISAMDASEMDFELIEEDEIEIYLDQLLDEMTDEELSDLL